VLLQVTLDSNTITLQSNTITLQSNTFTLWSNTQVTPVALQSNTEVTLIELQSNTEVTLTHPEWHWSNSPSNTEVIFLYLFYFELCMLLVLYVLLSIATSITTYNT
jgi:hypothetical protein